MLVYDGCCVVSACNVSYNLARVSVLGLVVVVVKCAVLLYCLSSCSLSFLLSLVLSCLSFPVPISLIYSENRLPVSRRHLQPVLYVGYKLPYPYPSSHLLALLNNGQSSVHMCSPLVTQNFFVIYNVFKSWWRNCSIVRFLLWRATS